MTRPTERQILQTVVMRAIQILVCMAVGLLSLNGCWDKVSSHYSTRKEAELDRLFERGWLPASIPVSSHRITTVNDLDLNTSEGEFWFAPAESVDFIRKLQPLDVGKLPRTDSARWLKSGHRPYLLAAEDFVWLFWVSEKQGHCAYWLRPKITLGAHELGAKSQEPIAEH